MRKAFFLDRDGTINVDFGYVGDPDDLKLLPGAAEAIKRMNDAGYLVVVISNQSGVARGYFGMKDVERVNARLNEMLGDLGARIDAFYFCPHLPGGSVKEFSVECRCRKPQLGLFEKAIEDFDLDVKKSFACGDKARDVENLSRIGFPDAHLGIIDGGKENGHYDTINAFCDNVLP